ncbi:hypothetical protein BX600DRAFT_429262 [Xylariales sp. PMI_506]|nr:hypothetical protein BX600DRAFT_429262 [Xylariales sp. PMI_506]
MSDQETKATEVADASKVDIPEAQHTTQDVEPTTESAKTDEEKPTETEDSSKTSNGAYSVRNPPPDMLRIKRPGKDEKEDGVKKNKFDPSVLQETSDPKLIRDQVQFYFSDSNLPTDDFLAKLTGLAENKPVPLSTICSFKRMRRFQPYSAVVTALKESKDLVIEGNEGEETIKRKKPFDPSKRIKVDERSVYVKGFGKEEPSTQFDIEAFFSQYGEFNSVRLRRADDGSFKGSAFVEWADKETADKFMALDPKPQWKTHGLLILWKLDYQKEKNEMIKSGDMDPSGRSARGRGNRGRGSGRHDSDNWKERRDRDQKRGFNDRRGGRNQRGRGRGNHRGGRGRDRDGEKRENKDQNENESSTNGKRARDEETSGEPPAKKVDTKEAVAEAA